jgi:hypothetical protein
VSEVVADLANDLVRRLKWDAALMKCPHQEALISDRAVDSDSGFVQADDSFGVAYPMSVVFPSDEGPRFECYLDDLFGVFREKDAWKAEAAMPLALHIVGQPAHSAVDESFPRDGLLAMSKFLAEAKASEREVILGLEVNTRSFAVSLPADKHRAWVRDLRRLGNAQEIEPGRRSWSPLSVASTTRPMWCQTRGRTLGDSTRPASGRIPMGR